MTGRVIIGTAGHIDHGKTELVRALTGQETDRLKDEKERGISIELGFAHYDIDGRRFGVIDVPGHERFIRQMLAGAHGIDLVLFVVAADDGIMPQTEEHFDILHLLGVRRGIFVVTKADLADESRLAEVRSDIEVLACGTAAESWPVCAVSSTTGHGLEELRRLIHAQLDEIPPRDPSGYFRLPIDRVFTLHGHGLVVTGTARSGSVREGETLAIRPGSSTFRARSVQVHGETVKEALAGQRVAVNLGGAERSEVERGAWLTDPRIEHASDRLDCWLELRTAARRPLESFERLRVYLGTTEVMGRAILLGQKKKLEPRSGAYCQLALESPVIASRGDRFIVRSEEASRTTGGGEIVHPFAPRHKSSDSHVEARLEQLRSGEPVQQIEAFIDLLREFVAPVELVAQALARTEDEVRRDAQGRAGLMPLPDASSPEALTTIGKWDRLVEMVSEALASFHESHPLAAGMELESLRSRLRVPMPAKLFRAVVDRLEATHAVVRNEALVRLPDHRVTLDRQEENDIARLEAALVEGGATPPDLRQLGEQLALSEPRMQELLRVLEQDGRAVRVAPDLHYAAPALTLARRALVEHLRARREITVADYRTLLSASRKYALALLEYFDAMGVTIRIGDVRKLRES